MRHGLSILRSGVRPYPLTDLPPTPQHLFPPMWGGKKDDFDSSILNLTEKICPSTTVNPAHRPCERLQV